MVYTWELAEGKVKWIYDDERREIYFIWWNSVASAWEKKLTLRLSDNFQLTDLVIEKERPTVGFKGLEVGGRYFTLREDGGKIIFRNITDNIDELTIDPAARVTLHRHLTAGGVSLDLHQLRHIYGGADALTGLDYRQLSADSIRLVSYISFGGTRIGLAADTTGVKYEAGSTVVTADLKRHLKAATFEVVLSRITGGTVAVELFDYTAGTVITSVSLTSATRRSTAAVDIAKLVVGNEVGVRWNVTSASAGAVFDADPVRLLLIYGIS